MSIGCAADLTFETQDGWLAFVQERLWITDSQRFTCLATVVQVRGDEFAVDKALFAPRSTLCRHPQNHDKGTVWVDGEKRKLQSVRNGAIVWYRLRGMVPAVGARLQCELDQDVRMAASRAHTALHLWLAHAPDVPMTANPEVRGQGHCRITYSRPVPPTQLAQSLARVNQTIAQDALVERRYVPKEQARGLTPQLFQPPDPVPGPDVLPLVSIGKTVYPCDGSHVDRLSRIGSVVVSHAAAGKDGFVVGLRVGAS